MNKRSMINLAAIALATLALAGCEKEGPAEKAGKEIDQVISKAGHEMQKVGDGIQDATRTVQK